MMRGADVASDHHLVIAKLRFKLRKYRIGNAGLRVKYQMNLLQDTRTREQFKLTLSNKFQPLQDLQEEDEADVNDLWKRVKESFTDACQEVLGLRSSSHKEWITQDSLDKIEERKLKK